MKRTLFVAVLLVLTPVASNAAITFLQLNETTFVIDHKVKIIGSRGKANRVVMKKAASVCEAAGFSHFEILDQTAEKAGYYEGAASSIRVKYHTEGSEDLIPCDMHAEPKWVDEARRKLEKRSRR